jgi:hypothetical protein
MSLRLHFGVNRYNRHLYDNFHPDMCLQNIASRMIDPRKVRGRVRRAFEQINRAGEHADRGRFARFLRMEATFREVYAELFDERPWEIYGLPERRLIEKQIKIDLAKNLWYRRFGGPTQRVA